MPRVGESGCQVGGAVGTQTHDEAEAHANRLNSACAPGHLALRAHREFLAAKDLRCAFKVARKVARPPSWPPCPKCPQHHQTSPRCPRDLPANGPAASA